MDKNSEAGPNGSVTAKLLPEDEMLSFLELFRKQFTFHTSKNEANWQQDSPERPGEAPLSSVDLSSLIEKQVSSFAIPSFSTVSLTTVWFMHLIGCLLCFVLAEVYQEYMERIPLTLLVVLGCHLIATNNFFPYMLGRNRYGAHRYRLYQPFKGGKRFIILQFFGISCVVFSLIAAILHTFFLLLSASLKETQHGFYTIVIVFGVTGNILLYLSPRYFRPHEAHKGGNVPAHTNGEREDTVYNETLFTTSALIELLYADSNSESVLVVIFVIAQFFVSTLAVILPKVAAVSSIFSFVLQLLIGATIHLFIGFARKPGYRFGALRLRHTADTIGFWAAQALYITSLVVNVFLLKSSTELHITPFALMCVTVLNGFSSIIFLLFMRTVSFCSNEATSSKSVFELCGVILSLVTYLLSAIYVVLTLYIALYETELDSTESGRSEKDVLHFCLQLVLVFLLLLPPITQVSGCTIHGAGFTISRDFQGKMAFLFIQGGSWLLYLWELLTTALFLFMGTHFFGLIASISSAFSVTCITFSVHIYNAGLDRSPRLDPNDPIPNFSSTRRGNSDVPDPHPDNRSKQWRSDLDSSFDKLRSLFLDSGEYSEDEVSRGLNLGDIFNVEMIFAYICAFVSFALCLVLELSDHYMWFDKDIQHSKVLLLGCLFFCVSAPLANFSARDKGIHMFYLFSGSPTFVTLHVLGWTLQVIGIVGNLFLLSQLQEKGATVASETHTIRGLLQFIPLILITISIALEYKNVLRNRQRRRLGIQALRTLNQILSKMATRVETPKDKVTLQIMFSAIAEPVLQTFDVPDASELLLLRPSPSTQDTTSPDRGCQPTPCVHRPAPRPDTIPDTAEDDDDEVDEERVSLRAALNAYERRRRHHDMGLIFLLLSFASVSLFTIAALPSSHEGFRVGCAVFGMVVCSGGCLGIHLGYGALLHPRGTNYAAFMPFRGGVSFVVDQCIGWTAYAAVIFLTLVTNEVPRTLGSGLMPLAAVLSVVAQGFLFRSIPKFIPTTNRHFLERNGEAAVSVLVFCSMIALNRLHMLFRTCLKDGLHGPASRESHTSFVLYVTTIGVLLAVPLILLAMSRTTQQWGRVQRRANHPPLKEATDSEKEHGADTDLDAQDGLSGLWVTVVTNILEIGTITLTMIAPFLTLFFLYYVFFDYTSPLLNAMSYYLPFMLGVALGTLMISAIPYLADVGIPHMVLEVRSTFWTYAVYSVPYVACTSFIAPVVLAPRLSTGFFLSSVIVLVVGGTYKQVQWAIKVAGYAIIGYLSYKVIVICLDEFKEPNLSIQGMIISRLPAYILDILFLGFWIVYIHSYRGRPYHTGSHRSPRFIKFMKRYAFPELTKYFSFRLILDSPKVNMRDSLNKYLFSYHPHGVIPGTALFAPFTDAWQEKVGTNAKTCVATHAASVIFNVPIIRDFNMCLNALSVGRSTIESRLDHGDSVIIVTGGQAEMLRTVSTDKYLELVTYHFGFVRLALRKRVPLVPLLCFGENNIMSIIQFPRLQKLTLKLLGFPFPFLLHGRFLFPLPRKTPLVLVVGSPVEIPAGADPENEEHVKNLAESYFQELEKLFYRHREEAGYPNMELRLIKRR